MKGKHSKSLGTIGDYEIGAKWQWKFNLQIATFSLFAITLILISTILAGSTYFWFQFTELSKAKKSLTDMQTEIIKLHNLISLELEEVRKLKEKFLFPEFSDDTGGLSLIRKKRSPIHINGGIVHRNKSKEIIKASNHKKNTSSKSSSFDHLHSSHVWAVHLERSNVSFSVTGPNGIINRWNPHYYMHSPGNYVQLEDQNSSLLILNSGLYLVYAQLCYAGTRENNSFEIRLTSNGETFHQSKIIAQCSAGTSVLENEITCFTSVVQILQPGDRVYLQQVQKKRQLLMSSGRSFMGLVKLSS